MTSRTTLLTTRTPLSRHAAFVLSQKPLHSRARHASAAPLILEKSTQTPAPAPLSALPTPVLLRSLLVSAISSKPYLLSPSLSVLSFLTKPHRGFLFSVDRNPVLHSFLKSVFYKQFCAGETPAETKETMRHLRFMGFRGTILTYAKETVFDHRTNAVHGLGIEADDKSKLGPCSNIEAWRKGVLETVDLLGDGDQLALKQQMMDALYEVSSRCQERGIRLLLDAESQKFQWGIFRTGIELMRRYNSDGGRATIYNTYQAYLKSTPDTLSKHLDLANAEGFTLGLKLVRGAYIGSDERSLIHDTKQDTDAAYDGIAQGALRRRIGQHGAPGGKPFPSLELFLASHNRRSVVAAHEMHRQRTRDGLPTVTVGFAQLQGMSDEVSFSLLQLGDKGRGEPSPQVWKCSTWGTMGECVAYLLRRAVENRDAVSRTVDEYAALKAELGRRMRARMFRSRTTKYQAIDMADLVDVTLCILGCGNLGIPILKALFDASNSEGYSLPIAKFIACVRSEKSEKALRDRFPNAGDKLRVSRGDNIGALKESFVVILGVDPSEVEAVLSEPGTAEALEGKILISVAAGWSRGKIESTLYGSKTTSENTEGRAWVVRTLPNIAAMVSQSLTAIETSHPPVPWPYLALTEAIFEKIGAVVKIPPKLMNATTAVGGSTPAFFAVICDAMIDAAVAVGVPRDLAQTMIFQSMLGTATLMKDGLHPALLKDQGTSPEGCTMGGLMVLEEAAVRGHVGRAVREAVTVARLMGNTPHVNDTRRS
ncbi:proline oxidase [Colletotrichum plurivorum]|uniref:Proline dehydrogenase n=1 Tax=Colletotrichum plurivorum TaxID=2175906 RepID=A0A8H6KGR2_9PEZI|nr:proline oxidase [Colletotrichum plurivorum]